MRRISAVVLTTGALVASVGAVAAPANAAAAAPVAFEVVETSGDFGASGASTAAVPRPKRWRAKNSLPRVSGWGRYTKGPRFVFGPGNNADGGTDGYQACLRFRSTKGRKKADLLGCVVDKQTRRPVDRVAQVHFRFKLPRGQHFYVQEVRRSMRTGKYQFGAWKRVF